MSYLSELRTHWRALAVAGLGLSVGYTLNNYTNNVFVPHLIQQFGWSSANIALIGTAVFFSALCQPIAGRLADRYGVRNVALAGVIATPAIYLALASMRGSFATFFCLNVAQIVIVAATTGPVVYSRLIAQRFERARGAALALATSSPAATGALLVPFLSTFIDAHGWRAGYVALAACTAAGGMVAILMMPKEARSAPRAVHAAQQDPKVWREILGSRAFLTIVAGMLLCNLSVLMQTSQLKVVLLGLGQDSATASLLISTYAAGVICGRFLCGFALDRFASHVVAAIALGVPGVGLAILAAGASTTALLVLAVLALGVALGAEGDVAAYLVMRHFKLEVYSTVLGLVVGSIAFSGAVGAALLSVTLDLTGSFTAFLSICTVSTLLGSLILLSLGGASRPSTARFEAGTEAVLEPAVDPASATARAGR